MDGLRDTIYVLRLLSTSPRLTKYERDCIRYALAFLYDSFGE